MLYNINRNESINLISEFETSKIKEYKQKLEDQLFKLKTEEIDLKQICCIEQSIVNDRKEIIKSTNSRISEYEYRIL